MADSRKDCSLFSLLWFGDIVWWNLLGVSCVARETPRARLPCMYAVLLWTARKHRSIGSPNPVHIPRQHERNRSKEGGISLTSFFVDIEIVDLEPNSDPIH